MPDSLPPVVSRPRRAGHRAATERLREGARAPAVLHLRAVRLRHPGQGRHRGRRDRPLPADQAGLLRPLRLHHGGDGPHAGHPGAGRDRLHPRHAGQPDGTMSVGLKDAHAWPELYFQGIGWTRFEPTPYRGTAPAYTQTAPAGGGDNQQDQAPQGHPGDPVDRSVRHAELRPGEPGTRAGRLRPGRGGRGRRVRRRRDRRRPDGGALGRCSRWPRCWCCWSRRRRPRGGRGYAAGRLGGGRDEPEGLGAVRLARGGRHRLGLRRPAGRLGDPAPGDGPAGAGGRAHRRGRPPRPARWPRRWSRPSTRRTAAGAGAGRRCAAGPRGARDSAGRRRGSGPLCCPGRGPGRVGAVRPCLRGPPTGPGSRPTPHLSPPPPGLIASGQDATPPPRAGVPTGRQLPTHGVGCLCLTRSAGWVPLRRAGAPPLRGGVPLTQGGAMFFRGAGGTPGRSLGEELRDKPTTGARRARWPSPLRRESGPPAGGRLLAQFLAPLVWRPCTQGRPPRGPVGAALPQGRPPRAAGKAPPSARAPPSMGEGAALRNGTHRGAERVLSGFEEQGKVGSEGAVEAWQVQRKAKATGPAAGRGGAATAPRSGP